MKHIWTPWRMKYILGHRRERGCVFCNELKIEDGTRNLIVYRGKLAFVILNRYPYTTGHLMVVPMLHQPSLELLDPQTRAEMMEMVSKAVTVLRQVYHPSGFNVGINIGEAAGAGVAGHVHIHVLPRWVGDTNFMSTVSDTRVLPEALPDSYQRILQAWKNPRD